MSDFPLYLIEALLLVTYAAAVFCLPKGMWPTRSKLLRDPESNAAIDKLKSEIKDSELRVLNSRVAKPAAEPDQFSRIQDKLFRAIDYAIRRHDWYEDQRFRIFQTVVGVATLALTFSGFFLKDLQPKVHYYLPFAGLFLLIFIALVAALFQYNKELDADRPYRLISDIRFWFFRYNLAQHSSVFSGPNIKARANAVAEMRRRFFDRIGEVLESYAGMREDFEQLFILQVLQLYKNESLKRLRWLLGYTLIFLPIHFAICLWVVSTVNAK